MAYTYGRTDFQRRGRVAEAVPAARLNWRLILALSINCAFWGGVVAVFAG